MEKPGSGMHVNKLGLTARQKLQCDEAPIQMLSAQMANRAYSSAPRLIQALTWFKMLAVRVKVALGEPELLVRRQPLQGFPDHWPANSLAGYGLPGRLSFLVLN